MCLITPLISWRCIICCNQGATVCMVRRSSSWASAWDSNGAGVAINISMSVHDLRCWFVFCSHNTMAVARVGVLPHATIVVFHGMECVSASHQAGGDHDAQPFAGHVRRLDGPREGTKAKCVRQRSRLHGTGLPRIGQPLFVGYFVEGHTH